MIFVLQRKEHEKKIEIMMQTELQQFFICVCYMSGNGGGGGGGGIKLSLAPLGISKYSCLIYNN